jgi:adenylate kinase
MNIVLFGPQGSGKGTQAKLLCEKFGFDYFESGEYLRKIAEQNESLRKMLDEGIMVPDIELTSYLTAFLDQEGLYDNILFDGFPRNLEQYNFLKIWLDKKQVKINLVLVLEISKKETLKRLSLRKREDDTTEAIEKRLELYKSRTEPLIQELEMVTKVVRVDGERSIEEIEKDLVGIVEATKGNNRKT